MALRPHNLLTYEDFAAFPDDGVRREIIDGEALVTPAPNIRHQDIAGLVFNAFKNHVLAHGGGRVFMAPTDVLLSDHDVVEPDVIFVADDRLDIVKENYILGTPSLLIEVLSDARTDRVRKRDRYAQAGVPEYWIVDPKTDRVEVYRLGDGVYDEPQVLEPGETLTTPLLPGLAIDLTTLLAR